jgi:hypothetical protein
MKNTMLILILMITFSASAQTNYIPSGTWRWTSGADTIELFLNPQVLTIENQTISVIIGFHKYVKNGTLIESSMSDKNTLFLQEKYSILIPNAFPHNRKQDGHINDITLNNKRMLLLEKLNPTTLKVALTYLHGIRNNRPYGFTLPKNFTLTKL